MAQRKRAGPITQRSQDRNLCLLHNGQFWGNSETDGWDNCRNSIFSFLQRPPMVGFIAEIKNLATSGSRYVFDFFIKTVPRARIELATFRLWDWRAAYCANEAVLIEQYIWVPLMHWIRNQRVQCSSLGTSQMVYIFVTLSKIKISELAEMWNKIDHYLNIGDYM